MKLSAHFPYSSLERMVSLLKGIGCTDFEITESVAPPIKVYKAKKVYTGKPRSKADGSRKTAQGANRRDQIVTLLKTFKALSAATLASKLKIRADLARWYLYDMRKKKVVIRTPNGDWKLN